MANKAKFSHKIDRTEDDQVKIVITHTYTYTYTCSSGKSTYATGTACTAGPTSYPS